MRCRWWMMALIALAGCRVQPDRLTAASDPLSPLWHRDGGERGHWSYGQPRDQSKVKILEEFEDKTRGISRGPWPAPVMAQARRLLADDDKDVALRALLWCGLNDHALMPEIESVHRRWKDDQVDWIFARMVADHWPDARLRSLFWSLDPASRTGTLYVILRRELARCGTLEDAARLEKLLPPDADWRRDPVIARIRVRHSRQPDRLAFEVLASYGAFRQSREWPAYLLRCDLLRYLAMGDDEAYRPLMEEHLNGVRFFCSDQETYPDVDPLLRAWIDRH